MDHFPNRRLAWLAATALAMGGVANAQPRPASPEIAGHELREAYPAQRGGISLAQATALAQSRYQGRVVRAGTFKQGDRVIYEIRILGNDNVVRTVLIDAQTGAFL
jgi:uncharacterized membrane protein YkoI